jgi:hypothetical protein
VPIALALLGAGLAACGGDSGAPGSGPPPIDTLSNQPPVAMPSLAEGSVTSRFTAELWVQGNTAYTTTWGLRGANYGNTAYIWDLSSAAPRLVDSLTVAGATTLGDIQSSDDGKVLVIATEYINGSIAIYDNANPRKPRLLTRYQTRETAGGVHTATLARVNGRLYAFLCIDPTPAALVILDLGDPAHPAQVWSKVLGDPYVHDVFVRDGILFTAEWDDGVGIWDLGGGGAGGSPSNPVRLATAATVGGEAHNVYWYHDPSSGAKRWLFVGQEGPGHVGATSEGDIHVIDVADLRAPKEVAFFHVNGAGTHNFAVDEASGMLYAAYYNAGVRALDVRGDLSSCTAAQRSADGRCDLALVHRERGRGLQGGDPVYVWGVYAAPPVVYASDMLSGIWKLGAVTR